MMDIGSRPSITLEPASDFLAADLAAMTATQRLKTLIQLYQWSSSNDSQSSPSIEKVVENNDEGCTCVTQSLSQIQQQLEALVPTLSNIQNSSLRTPDDGKKGELSSTTKEKEPDQDVVVNDEELKRKLLEDQHKMLEVFEKANMNDLDDTIICLADSRSQFKIDIIRMMTYGISKKRKRKAVFDTTFTDRKKKPDNGIFCDTTYGKRYMRYEDLPFILTYYLEALIPIISIKISARARFHEEVQKIL
ncbi:hypothetical protein L6452_19525 [Arctium lappa]|uniref:Uncharacterized protein n=1 Tax=Arctium lappa TaxID=4217 RepID=A0ACB9BA76_ARCLA|nr:hypothetical protein L6452_19525 [Arctium lappa]